MSIQFKYIMPVNAVRIRSITPSYSLPPTYSHSYRCSRRAASTMILLKDLSMVEPHYHDTEIIGGIVGHGVVEQSFTGFLWILD